MRILGRYPAGTAIGCDFVSRSSELAEGERVVNLDVDLETLPGWGLLCLSESTVKGIVRELGIDLLDPDSADKIRADRKELEALRSQNIRLREAIIGIVDLCDEFGVTLFTRDGVEAS